VPPESRKTQEEPLCFSVWGIGWLWQPAPGCGPIVVGSERQSESLVRYPQIAVATDKGRVGSDSSDFLRNHPDIGLLAAVVSEAVVTETVVEPAQQYDIVFQSDIRPPTATTTTPSAAASAAAETTTTPSATGTPECGSPSPTGRTHASGVPVIPGSRSRARAARSHVP
jgi:hypothetical protein